MHEDDELRQLDQVRAAITLDQSMWQIDPVDFGRVGLTRWWQVNDYVRGDATVEVDDEASELGFIVQGVITDSYDPVERRTVRCGSVSDAAVAAVDMLRWVVRTASALAGRTSDQAP